MMTSGRKPTILCLGVLVGMLGGGCAQNIAGGWETVSVHPPQGSFPFQRIEFDPAGKYTASGLYDGSGRMTAEVRTTTGDFRHTAGRLEILPHKGDAQTYRVRRRMDGHLEITLDAPGQGEPLRAIFAPAR